MLEATARAASQSVDARSPRKRPAADNKVSAAVGKAKSSARLSEKASEDELEDDESLEETGDDTVEPDEDEEYGEGEDEGEALDDQEDDDEEDSPYDAVDDADVMERARAVGVETPGEDRFFDVHDAPLRARMTVLSIAKVKRGSGGRSLGFKITLSDGTKAYFKAEQTFSAANWNSEVAAYHLDRMLGFHRVPPVVSRAFEWEDLRAAAGRDKRRDEIIVQKDGSVRGAFIWWIPGGLRTWPDLPGFEQWIRVRGWPSTTVSSLQRPAKWAHQLRLRREKGDDWLSPRERHRRRNFNPRRDRPDRDQELSDLIVFDYLTKNVDRWGGRNANVLIRGRRGPLVFLDNGAGFAPGRARPSLVESRLHVLQKFRRSTVRAVKSFDVGKFKERLEKEPLAPILHTREFRHLKERQKALLEWIRRMERRYGERAFPWE